MPGFRVVFSINRAAVRTTASVASGDVPGFARCSAALRCGRCGGDNPVWAGDLLDGDGGGAFGVDHHLAALGDGDDQWAEDIHEHAQRLTADREDHARVQCAGDGQPERQQGLDERGGLFTLAPGFLHLLVNGAQILDDLDESLAACGVLAPDGGHELLALLDERLEQVPELHYDLVQLEHACSEEGQ